MIYPMTNTEANNGFYERNAKMDNERSILLKLTDFLQKENLISAEERNRAVALIEQEGII